MKVHPYGSETMQGLGNPLQRKAGAGLKGGFYEVLQKAVGEPGQVSPGGVVSPISEPGPPEASSRSDALALGEETLGLLARCTEVLAEPEASQTALRSLADALAERLGDLKAVRDRLGDDDPVRGSIERIGILSAVESTRISRGDYF